MEVSKTDIINALKSDINDFEDAIQYSVAIKVDKINSIANQQTEDALDLLTTKELDMVTEGMRLYAKSLYQSIVLVLTYDFIFKRRKKNKIETGSNGGSGQL